MRLFPYQAEGVEWLRATVTRHGAAILADDMGVGKTPQFLAAPPAGAPVVVVVPASLKAQTAERIVEWRGSSTRVRVADGLGALVPPEPGEWVVLNPDILPATAGEMKVADERLREAIDAAAGQLPLDAGRPIDVAPAEKRVADLRARGAFQRGSLAKGTWLIVDEAHEFNNVKSAQTKRMRALVSLVAASGGGVIAATATPLLNDPADLRSLLATFRLGGAAWPAKKGRALDYWGFLRDWGGAKGRFGEEWNGEPRQDRIAEALRRVMLRRLFRDVVDIPPMAPWERIDVDLDATTRELADHADEAIRGRVGDLARSEKIVFETCSKVRAALAVAKIPAAHEWCDRMERAGEPAVVACVSKDVVREIGRRPGWAKIDGGESADSRAATVKAFQRGELRGVALTHAAGGVGVDLYRSARMLMVSREWNPAKNRQTLARVVRQGQERPVRLSMLYAAHAIEERLDELLAGRKRLMQAIDAAAWRPEGVRP